MLPKKEFVVLPAKTPKKKKAVKGSAAPVLPTLELDDSGSNLRSTYGGRGSMGSSSSRNSRNSRKAKGSKAKGKQAQKVVDFDPQPDDESTNQGPLTLEDLRYEPSCSDALPAQKPTGRQLRSTRASSKRTASAMASPKQQQRVSTRSMRQAAAGGSRKLSTHSRNCPFSPHRTAAAAAAGESQNPAASTPDNPAEQRKQRTLRLKRNAAANKRLFLTPEKKKKLFGMKFSSPVGDKRVEASSPAIKKNSMKASLRSKVHELIAADAADKSCPDIAEHFMTANESPIEKQLLSPPAPPSPPPAPPLLPDMTTRACVVKLTPLKKDIIHKWLESANPVVDDLDQDDETSACDGEVLELMTDDSEDKENSAIFVDVPPQTVSKSDDERKSSPRSKPALRSSRKRSSRQAELSEPLMSNTKILKEDNAQEEKSADSSWEAMQEDKNEECETMQEDKDEECQPMEKEDKDEECEPMQEDTSIADRDLEEVQQEEEEDDIAPLPAVPVVTNQVAPKDISADDSLFTDDEWSTMNDDDNDASLLNHSSASAGQMNTPSHNQHRPRLAHSADGGTKRFSRVKRWVSGDSSRKSNSSADQSTSRLSNMSTPGRLQKRLSSSRHQEMEEERRRELKERMQKDLQRLRERESRLAQEREARKRANEARRQQVLSKRDAVFKEKLSTMQQLWEKKEQHLAEQERERREEELRRKQAMAQLRKQNEQREREERERREADARRQREEAVRKMKEEADRRAREAEKKAKEEAERRAKEEAAKKVREEAERRAKEDAARKAREEEERRAKEEAARKEAERRAKEEARRAAEIARRAREEERRRREEEERKRAALLRERTLQMEMARKEAELASLRYAVGKTGEQPPKKANRSDENYDISDLHSDQETDDDEDPRKKVPIWATKSSMKRKCRHFMRLDIKWWKIFRPAETLNVDLNSIFSESRRSFRPRTSSAIWHTPPALNTTPRH